MKTPQPCVLVWLASSGTSSELDAAYNSLCAEVAPPSGRSMVVSGEDELVSVEETIEGLPLSERYAEAVIDAARRKGFDRSKFVAAIFFREKDEARKKFSDHGPTRFVGVFDFPFPERGDHIPRDEHEWLGIDSAYCSDERTNSSDDDGYIGHF